MKAIQAIKTKPTTKIALTRDQVIAQVVATQGSNYRVLRQVRAAQ